MFIKENAETLVYIFRQHLLIVLRDSKWKFKYRVDRNKEQLGWDILEVFAKNVVENPLVPQKLALAFFGGSEVI